MAVVTNMGVLKFQETTKKMYLSEYYPGVAREAITDEISFPVDVSGAVESLPPSAEESDAEGRDRPAEADRRLNRKSWILV